MNTRQLIGIAIAISGVAVAVAVSSSLGGRLRLMFSGERTTGKIVGYRAQGSATIRMAGREGPGVGHFINQKQARAIVEFAFRDGETRQFVVKDSLSRSLGDSLTVAYDRADPARAVVLEPEVFIAPIAGLVLGLTCILIGGYLALLH